MIVVEVLSPATRAADAGRKLTDYLRVPTIRHILIVDAVQRMVTWHARRDATHADTVIATSGVLTLDPPGVAVEVAAFFESLP